MMEEWHQKLHNNSSPDDLAICQALLDYLEAGQQQDVYWASLASAGARGSGFDACLRRLHALCLVVRMPPDCMEATHAP